MTRAPSMRKKNQISPILKEVVIQLFRKPATQKYPQVKPKINDGFRGKIVFDITLCISCGLCARDCPAKAIVMVDVDGKKRPEFHSDRCIFCGLCAEVCPRHAIVNSIAYELAAGDKASLVIKPQNHND
jgi:formate hydrogenlyase subunit 6/NADH:ubiquinone oxidoreductase subunit I